MRGPLASSLKLVVPVHATMIATKIRSPDVKHLATLLMIAGLFCFFCASVNADSDSNNDSGTNIGPPPTGRGRSSGRHHNPNGSNKNSSAAGKLRGHCTLMQSQDNPIAGPCVNTMLVLNDADGTELDRTRTSENGDFEFPADPKDRFHITSGSRFYDVDSPTGLLRSGQKVDLVLRQKP